MQNCQEIRVFEEKTLHVYSISFYSNTQDEQNLGIYIITFFLYNITLNIHKAFVRIDTYVILYVLLLVFEYSVNISLYICEVVIHANKEVDKSEEDKHGGKNP